jgi:predicted enzyme related to lactoylglutathione lyase
MSTFLRIIDLVPQIEGSTEMLRGMSTLNLFADDVEAARDWYSQFLGVDAYFARPAEGPPAYVEFRIGDLDAELGIIDRRYAPAGAGGPGGAILYWHVDDVHAAVKRLLSMGAKELDPITERGPGFVTASVVDPFGNVLGVMYNQHYLDTLDNMLS